MQKSPRFLISHLITDRRQKQGFLFLVGGVFLVAIFALIPDNSYATEFIQSESAYTYFSVRRGCNTVNSFSGFTAVGPRGSISGADNNPSGCNYYFNSDYHLTWRDNEEYFNAGITFDDSGNFDSISRSESLRGLSDQDYINYGFRSSVVRVLSSVFTPTFSIIPQKNFSQDYGSELVVVPIKWYDGLISSGLTPTIRTNFDTTLTDSQDDVLKSDVFDNSVYICGSPRSFVNDYVYADLEIKLSGSLDKYCYIIAYLPQYSYQYQLADIWFSNMTSLTQNSYDNNLGGFQQFEVGLGNHVGSATFPRLDYFTLSSPYGINNDRVDSLVQTARFLRYRCLNQSCVDDSQVFVQNVRDKHIDISNSFGSNSNPAGTWFDIFGSMSILNPFRNFAQMFTANQCVNIPIIAGMLNVSNTQYCSWWSQSTRDVLTPVVAIATTMILFGFVVSWLKGSSNNLFDRDSQVGK